MWSVQDFDNTYMWYVWNSTGVTSAVENRIWRMGNEKHKAGTQSRDGAVVRLGRTYGSSLEWDGAVEEKRLDWIAVLKLLGINLCLAEENFQMQPSAWILLFSLFIFDQSSPSRSSSHLPPAYHTTHPIPSSQWVRLPWGLNKVWCAWSFN